MKLTNLIAFGCLWLVSTAEAREQIGEVLGKPVYRDQILSKEGRQLGSEPLRLFAGPLWKRYLELHKKQLEPTEQEIKASIAYFQEWHRKGFPGLRYVAEAVARRREPGPVVARIFRRIQRPRDSTASVQADCRSGQGRQEIRHIARRPHRR